MRRQFSGYYYPKDEDFARMFKECVFCFDTSVLLNLYRFTPESRDKLIQVLQSVKDRVWLPHQVGLEYQRHRIDELLQQIKLSEKIEKIIGDSIIELNGLRRKPELFTVNKIVEPIKKQLDMIKKKIQKQKQQKPDLMTGDPVFDAVTDLFEAKVGSPYSEEEYENLYRIGRKRYEVRTPPGYMDQSKNPNDKNQYGDFVIWRQLIDYAKTEKRPIIFITDDAKEDWWREIMGEKLGPRPELVTEFVAATGGGKLFYMYSTEQFLNYSNVYLAANVQPEVIKEAEGIKQLEKIAEIAANACETMRIAKIHQKYDLIIEVHGQRKRIIEAHDKCYADRELICSRILSENEPSGIMTLAFNLAPGGSQKAIIDNFLDAGLVVIELSE